jgi:hypothetical protein
MMFSVSAAGEVLPQLRQIWLPSSRNRPVSQSPEAFNLVKTAEYRSAGKVPIDLLSRIWFRDENQPVPCYIER